MLRIKKQFVRRILQRRFTRYSLLAGNLIILIVIVVFVAKSAPAPEATNLSISSSAAASSNTSDPLDQLSSADIAVTLAAMANLPETTAVTNQADSVGAELAIPPGESTIITKPQAVTTDLKSRKDIVNYVVQPGDTVATIATQYGVTSDSITSSNNISGNVLAAGAKLVIPPVNGLVYTVKTGDTPDSLAQKYRANSQQIITINDAELSGLSAGEQIVIPDGQLPPPPVPVVSYSYFAAVYGYNGYDYGFCTWYVANRRIQIGNPLPANLGDASTWDYRAIAAGMNVNKTPAVGAAVVTSHIGAGHVAFVEKVNDDGSVWVSEMNSSGQVSMTDTARAGGWGRVDFKLLSASAAGTYNYIH